MEMLYKMWNGEDIAEDGEYDGKCVWAWVVLKQPRREDYRRKEENEARCCEPESCRQSLNLALAVGRDPGGTGDARPRLLAYARDLAGLGEVVPVHDIPGAQ
jgi:hypothetical protein